MANDDFLVRSATKQYQTLQAGRDEAVANLSNARRYGDEETAAENIQYIANIDAQIRDLNDLCNRHAASQQPPPEPSREELMAKPIDRTTQADMYRILKMQGMTKHGIDDAGYLAGMREVAARRARGE
jgi:hypothetical protein